ncbi:extracellular solute-binding protein [Alloacidobacterium dinghuense]|uniref:Extracellular solute-binding protein n=1 Tax=Alloacidobacterium dinghuense TaxID=2763107 RepID=A0A7G8BGI6_9BACT|nr:extracellular solute-binding protein [Alloacidobacterium dinghuense]QNI31656.1 extracellular solute-binding protein [Alloacidobacterium dinghuense]
MSAEFTTQTGIRLENIRGVPAETLDQLSFVRKLLQQGSEGPEVLEVDETWLGMLKDDLLDLRPYMPDLAHSIAPALESSYFIGGKLVAIPYQNHVGVLAFRADLLRKYGFGNPPATWTELERMALRIQEGERAHGNKDFWGYVWPGAAEESLTCNALEWQVDEGGGKIIESDGAVSVDNPAAIHAWQRAKHWIGWISPPSVPEYRESDALGAFNSGRSAFLRVWAGEPGGDSSQQDSNLHVTIWGTGHQVGEMAITALPGGSVSRVGTLGGVGLAVSKYSKHPQEDAALVRFLLRKQLESFEKGEIHLFVAKPALYDVSSSNPDTARAIVIARPTRFDSRDYEKVSREYFGAVHAVLTGEKRASAAAFELQKNLVRITGQQPGLVARE